MFYIKQNDTSPAYRVVLKDATDTIVDVTGATVEFHMALPNSTTLKVSAAGSVIDGPTGVVEYAWAAGDTDTAGVYVAEFQITYADTSIETFPNGGYNRVKITPELG